MSITALQQVFQEVRRLSVAGSDLAADDFRLKKLVPPLEKSAKKAPVFAKVVAGIDKVLGSTSKNSAEALLELSSLVSAVLYTQGQTAVEGDLEAIPPSAIQLTAANTSARVLKPLIEALTTTGSGRLEIIQDAASRGALHDLRLVRPALAALDDPYPEIADFVAANVLPKYGRALLPELRRTFDAKGRGPAARRLRLMSKLDPDGSHPTVLEALEEGSKEVKLAALACCEGREDAADLLLSQLKSRTKDVRAAAFQSLARIDTPDVVEALKAGLSGKDVALVAPHVALNPSPELGAMVLEELSGQLATTLAIARGERKGKGKTPLVSALERLHVLIRGVTGRSDGAAVACLQAALQEHATLAPLVEDVYESGELAVERIANALLLTRDDGALDGLAAFGAEAPAYLLPSAFTATSLRSGPEAAHDTFVSVYLDRPKGRSKGAGEARDRARAMQGILQAGARHTGDYDYWHTADDTSVFSDLVLDPRWLDAVIEARDGQLVLALAVTGHEGLHRYLEAGVKAELSKKKWEPSYELGALLRGLLRSEHPNLVPLFVDVVRRCAKMSGGWNGYLVHINVFNLIPDLPKAAIEPLRALLPDMSDKLLDGYAEPLDALIRAHAAG